jgi:trk system potassium uptake protein TrkH
MFLGGLMLTALPFSIAFKSNDFWAITYAAAVTFSIGLGTWFVNRNQREKIGKREGYMIVVLAWLGMCFFSTLPYLFSGTFVSFTDAMFESVSGLTTTGASVMNDIEAVSEGILFWRSLTQWIGGMGIIVLTVALFPLLGIGGVELFVAEAPGPTSDKIHPQIKETAKLLWMIYVGLTIVLCIILALEGMTFYDSINHALTTMATGGFSTKNGSIADFPSPLIQYTLILFMFLAGTNYTILYYGLNGRFQKVWRSDEFKTYVVITFGFIALLTLLVLQFTDHPFELAFREVSFQVISLITTTGFVSADYTSWASTTTMICFILLFVGACAGSTSGGIKIIRHLVFFKNSILEFKRILHPRGLIRIKIDKKIVAPKILTHILVFLLIYLIIFVIGSIVMSFILADFEQPFLTAIGSVATSLGNVGPGIGQVGPVDNFAAIPKIGKWFLAFLMLLGRLELFTILVLFMPYFWKIN